MLDSGVLSSWLSNDSDNAFQAYRVGENHCHWLREMGTPSGIAEREHLYRLIIRYSTLAHVRISLLIVPLHYYYVENLQIIGIAKSRRGILTVYFTL